MKSKMLAAAFLFVSFAASAEAAPLQVCVDKSGKVVAATRCTKGQTLLNTNNLSKLGIRGAAGEPGPQGPVGPQGSQGPMGPQGPAGIGISACRITVASASSTDLGTGGVNLLCNTNEFLLTWGWWTAPLVLDVLRLAEPIAYNGVIYGIRLITQNDFGVPYYDSYTLNAAGTCCPRT